MPSLAQCHGDLIGHGLMGGIVLFAEVGEDRDLHSAGISLLPAEAISAKAVPSSRASLLYVLRKSGKSLDTIAPACEALPKFSLASSLFRPRWVSSRVHSEVFSCACRLNCK